MIKEKEIRGLEAETAYLKKRAESLELKAPFSGILLSDLSEKVGNLIREGEFLLELVDPASFYLEFLIPERAINKVSVGDLARIRFRAVPWRTFQGEVRKIGRATKEEVEKVFKVRHVIPCEIELREPFPNIRLGARARVILSPRRYLKTPKEDLKIEATGGRRPSEGKKLL